MKPPSPLHTFSLMLSTPTLQMLKMSNLEGKVAAAMSQATPKVGLIVPTALVSPNPNLTLTLTQP